MSDSLKRLMKFAELIKDESFDNQLNLFMKKHGHMEAINDGTTPNPWRTNTDYDSWENSPYYGSIKNFMEKFPGGIPEWRKYREETEKERFMLWSNPINKIKERKAYLEKLMEKTGHFEPVGPDDTEKFPDEPHIYSGENVEEYDSIEDFVEKHRKEMGKKE